jgi:hypothetical protein
LMDIALACPVTLDGLAPPEEHDRFRRSGPGHDARG